jgi:mycothiol synthase
MSDRSSLTLPPPPQSHQLRFLRLHLDDLPEMEAPDEYRLRNYQPGDEAAWAATLNAAFPESNGSWTEEKIEKEFTLSELFRPERIFFVERDGRIIGVAAAWQRDDPDWGYVHWVGVEPGHQGKRLGRLVTLATLHQFKREGKRASFLETDEPRIPAIRTYLSLGFEPDLRGEKYQEMWARIEKALQLGS